MSKGKLLVVALLFLLTLCTVSVSAHWYCYNTRPEVSYDSYYDFEEEKFNITLTIKTCKERGFRDIDWAYWCVGSFDECCPDPTLDGGCGVYYGARGYCAIHLDDDWWRDTSTTGIEEDSNVCDWKDKLLVAEKSFLLSPEEIEGKGIGVTASWLYGDGNKKLLPRWISIEVEVPECEDNEDCDDGLYCNGVETCEDGECISGDDINCSLNDILRIATCTNNPDNNPLTWDFFAGFTSVCNEDLDACTTGTVDLTHTCDISWCGAGCEDNEDCDDTKCGYLNGCYGGTYRDYNNVENTCLDCLCTSNSCTVYNEIITDVDGDGYDTECDNDCDDSNSEINPGAEEICDDGIDNDCDGLVDLDDDECEEEEEITCFADEDCGFEYFGIYISSGCAGGSNYCCNENRSVCQLFVEFTCHNPGTLESYCTNSTYPLTLDYCGESYCEEWGGNYCGIDGNVHKNRTCYEKGCESGFCFSSEYVNEEQVDLCEFGCEEGECLPAPECEADSDCGNITSELICQGNNVTNMTTTPNCVDGYCELNITYEFIEECEFGCKNGVCLDEEEEDNGNGGRRVRINYCGDGYCDVSIGEDKLTCPEDCEFVFETLYYRAGDGTSELNETIILMGKIVKAKEEPGNFWLWLLLILIIIAVILILIVNKLKK